MEWCTNNMHPYNIDFIYSELNESFDINSFDAEMVERDGRFEIDNFLGDLEKLYNAFMFYIALEDICVAADDTAYDLFPKGKCFEGYSFFDKYKRPIVAIPDDLDYGNAKGNLIEKCELIMNTLKIIRQQNFQLENLQLRHTTFTMNYGIHLLTSFRNLP